MSFEDDAYWDSEYTDRSSTRYGARAPASASSPVDELAVRRKRRQGRYRRPPRRDGGVQKGFDTERPSWLDDPDFVPTDVSGPDIADHDSALLDFNRPELGATLDRAGPRWTRDVPRVEDDDWDDEIDEPYDHRVGMERRPTVRGLDGYVPAPPAVGTASVSPAAATTVAPVSSQPVPPAGVRPPVQRPPADAGSAPPDPLGESTPDISPRRRAGDDVMSGWFAAKPRRPAAASETIGLVEDGSQAVPDARSAVTSTPEPPASALGPDDLRAVRWRLDGATLREVVDDQDALRELGSRLDGPLAEETSHVARAGLLSLRAEVYRLLGELGMAAAASRLALAHAESARDAHAIVIVQAELAHVLRVGGHHAEADRLLEEAASSDAPELLRSVVHEYAGRSCFDQGRHMEALDHFARAIRLGAPDDLDLVERIEMCLEAVYIHVLRDGWGPYPRLRREILGLDRPVHPEPHL